MTLPEPQNRFTRRQQLGAGSVRVAAFVFLGIVSVIGWSYVLLASEALSIKDIEVRGLVDTDPIDIKREVYDAIDEQSRTQFRPARHVWFIREEELLPSLTQKLFTEDIKIAKDSGNILRLMIKERAKRIILQTSQQLLWVDARGLVLNELTVLEAKALRTRTGSTALNIQEPPVVSVHDLATIFKPGERIPSYDVRTWLDIGLALEKQAVRYREIIPAADASSTRLSVRTFQGYAIWFDMTSDTLQKQIEAYKAFEKQRPKDLKINEYVDARIPGRVYVR